jgi:hypothetical protein
VNATYTKLSNGDWGVLCDTRPNVGDAVTVTKRDKSTKRETIAQVWTRGEKFACAITTEHGGECANCNRHSNHRTKRYDTNGIEGMVCDRCSSLPKYELSFG